MKNTLKNDICEKSQNVHNQVSKSVRTKTGITRNFLSFVRKMVVKILDEKHLIVKARLLKNFKYQTSNSFINENLHFFSQS